MAHPEDLLYKPIQTHYIRRVKTPPPEDAPPTGTHCGMPRPEQRSWPDGYLCLHEYSWSKTVQNHMLQDIGTHLPAIKESFLLSNNLLLSHRNIDPVCTIMTEYGTKSSACGTLAPSAVALATNIHFARVRIPRSVLFNRERSFLLNKTPADKL